MKEEESRTGSLSQTIAALGIIFRMSNLWISVLVEHELLQLNHPYIYVCPWPVKPGVRVRVPFGRQKSVVGFVSAVYEEMPDFLKEDPKLASKLKAVQEVLDDKPVLSPDLMELAQILAKKNISPLISMIKQMLPSALKPNTSRKKEVFEDWLIRPDNPDLPSLTKRQKEVLEELSWPMKASEARKESSPAIIRALLDKGALIIEKRRKEAELLPQNQHRQPPRELTPSQKEALDTLWESDRRVRLLYGVTGSGKTEVFFQLAQRVLDEGKQVIMLVPEISLTPMMINRITSRFDVPVLVYHSRLGDQEKLDQYYKAKTDKPCIVIGTRSAVFMPLPKLGLIIMDEEHDASYKQDSVPKYHARDAAEIRAKQNDCPLILSSATPCLETFARAQKGVYDLAVMPDRIADSFPEVRIIDLHTQQMHYGLSGALISLIEQTLARKEKVILLLNRRGYYPVIQCTNCHEPVTCPDCGVPLSYHKQTNTMVCHICSNTYNMLEECPHCHQKSWLTTGMGTEKLEENIQGLFPQASIVRMDSDTTRFKNAHATLLEEFEQEGDILLGTQMITKGLDIEKVTLVGILGADAAMNRADFRAGELAYQMMEQASGRAGRGKLKGTVCIQTWNPDSYILQCIRRHSYRGFFNREMRFRHAGFYPPYCYLASVVFTGEDPMQTWQFAQSAWLWLKNQEIDVFGPLEISRRLKQTRFRLLIKARKEEQLEEIMWSLQHWLEEQKTRMTWEINMNPVRLEE